MPGTIIAGELLLAGFISSGAAYAATAFAVNLVASYAISRIFTPNQPQAQDAGARVQLPPSTRNKLPLVYGTAWVRPTITDAKISTDQTTMWYVCSLCETPNGITNSIGDIYWGDKLLNFDTVDQTKVVSWTETDGSVSTDPNGLIYIYKYGGDSATSLNTASSAITVLQDAAIPAASQWTSTDRMNRVTFIIVKLTYNSSKGLTGLDNLNIKVVCPVTLPGDCIRDYLTNTQYGCAVPSTQWSPLNQLNLNTYSNQLVNFGATTQARYRFNGIIDTGRDCFQNLITMAENCDSWMQWNEATAQWSVIINKAYDQAPNAVTLADLFSINDNNIIGTIQFTPTDLSSSYNRYESKYYETTAQDKEFREYGELSTNLLNPNEPDNPLSLDLVLTNNNLQAGYLATRRMLQSREDLVITLNVDYSGIQIDAGDVVRVTSAKFGWTDKLFRVAQVVEGRDTEGILSVQLTMNEYNGSVYNDVALTSFIPSSNSGVSDPNVATAPAVPTLFADNRPTTMTWRVTIPASGLYNLVELWVETSTSGPPGPEGWPVTLAAQQPAAGNYVNGQTVDLVVGKPVGLAPITRYKARVRTSTGIYSDFSAYTAYYTW